VSSSGTGVFATDDGTGDGTALAFGLGDLASAPAGALTVVFDVNFMQWGNQNSENFTRNLIGFIDDEVDPDGAVPEPASLAIWGSLGIAAFIAHRRRRKLLAKPTA
jgi:hypothetical protein